MTPRLEKLADHFNGVDSERGKGIGYFPEQSAETTGWEDVSNGELAYV
jgi:hypothetical protein